MFLFIVLSNFNHCSDYYCPIEIFNCEKVNRFWMSKNRVRNKFEVETCIIYEIFVDCLTLVLIWSG